MCNQIISVYNKQKFILVQDIQVFIKFTHFYKRFIEGFYRIVALVIFLLKILTQTVIYQNIDKHSKKCEHFRQNKNKIDRMQKK